MFGRGLMRSARSRLGKGFSFEERILACQAAVETAPYGMRGRWKHWLPKAQREAGQTRTTPFDEVRLDLGCGKGHFTVECAKQNLGILFVGVDVEELCILRSAELAVKEGVENVVFVLDRFPTLKDMFAPGELSQIFLMFPTPFPKKKYAEKRTVIAERLAGYRRLLEHGGLVRFEIDSQPLFDFGRIQFDLAGFDVLWETRDLEADYPSLIAGEYKQRLTARGACVHALLARNGEVPVPEEGSIMHEEPLSLIDYLPDDLEGMEYVPHGMEGCVTNMRNRRRNERARKRREEARLK